MARSFDIDRLSIDDLSITRMNGAPGGLSGANADILQQIKINTGTGGTLSSTINAGIEKIVAALRSGNEELKRANISQPESGGIARALGEYGEALNKILGKIEDTLLIFEERSEKHGSDSGGFYSNTLKLREISLLEKLSGRIDNFFNYDKENKSSLTNLFRGQQATTFKNFINNVTEAALRLSDLGAAFSSAKRTFTSEGGTFMKDIFGSNILTPGEFFLNGWNLLSRGLFSSTDNLITTLEFVKKALDSDMMSPLASTGQSLTEYAASLRKIRQEIYNAPGGEDIRRFGITTGELNKTAQDIFDTLHRQGIHSQITDSIVAEYSVSQLTILREISANTGMTVDKLEESAKKFSNDNARLEAFARMTPRELNNFSAFEAGIQATLKDNAKPILDVMHAMAAARQPGMDTQQNINSFLADQNNKQWVAIESAAPGTLEAISKAIQFGMAGNTAAANRQLESLNQTLSRLNVLPTPVLTSVFGNWAGDLAGLKVGANLLGTAQPPSTAQQTIARGSDINESIGKLQDLWTNTISPLFGGFAGSVVHMMVALGSFAASMMFSASMISRSIAAQASFAAGTGFRGTGGALLSTAGRVLGPLGAAGIAYETGGGVGGTVGAGLGAVVGGALGSLVGPLGTAIGMTAGGYFGEKFGEYINNNISPATSSAITPAQNPVGPSATVIGAEQQNESWQDNTVSLLTQMIALLSTNNDTSARLLNETSRQTGIMINGIGRGTGGTLQVPDVGNGFVGAGQPSKSSRPDMSYAQGTTYS